MRKGEQTRERVLNRAAALFNQHGYTGASLSDLMRVTGLEKGGIYNHFSSKEQLALEAFDHAITLIGQHYARALAGKRGAVERLLAIMSVFRSFVEDPPIPGGCPLLNTAIESDDAHPILRDQARQAMDKWRRLIQLTVARGITRHEINPNIDPDSVATLFISSLEGAVMMSKLYNDPIHMHRVIDHLVDYIEHTLCKK